jgi:hypothetical protein
MLLFTKFAFNHPVSGMLTTLKSKWFVLGSVAICVTVAYAMHLLNRSVEHKRAINFAGCVIESLERARVERMPRNERDQSVLLTCNKYAPVLPLSIESSSDQMLALRDSKGGVIVFWRLSEHRPRNRETEYSTGGYRWVHKDLNFGS